MGTAQVVAAAKRVQALELAAQGMPYRQIAERVGYAHKGSVSRAVWHALDECTAAGAAEFRQVELDRLDALQAAHWDRALDGDVRCAQVVLRCIEARTRLLGLDQPATATAEATSVIAPGCEQQYAEALRANQGR